MEKASETWLEWLRRMIRDMTAQPIPVPPLLTKPTPKKFIVKVVAPQPPRTTMPHYNQEQLRVKRKSLAAETRIIRDTELKWKERASKAAERQKHKAVANASNVRQELYNHRVNKVRPEARKSHLADAFLRGMPYVVIEQTAWTKNIPVITVMKFWQDVADMAWKFSGGVKPKKEVYEEVIQWRNQHPSYGKKSYTAEELKKYGDMFLYCEAGS